MVHLVLDGRYMGTETERRQGPSGQAIFKPFRWSRGGEAPGPGAGAPGPSQLERHSEDCP